MPPSPQVNAKTERLLNLVMCLLYTRRALTRDQIRRAIPAYQDAPSDDAFERTFERDKDELRELGIPISTEQLDSFFEDEVGYRIDKRDYAIPEVSFTVDELTVLGLASRTWAQASLAGPAAEALRKLAATGVERDDSAVVGFEPRVGTREPAFEAVRSAVLAHREITFDYRKSRDAQPESRRLQAWALAGWHGRWYVTGYDLDRAGERVFRLDRFVGPVRSAVARTPHSMPEDHDPMAAIARAYRGDHAPEPVTAVVLVREGRGQALRRLAATTSVATDVQPVPADTDPDTPAGWSRLELTVRTVEQLEAMVAELGADAVPLAPERFVAGVRSRWEGARAGHGRATDRRPDHDGGVDVARSTTEPATTQATTTQAADRVDAHTPDGASEAVTARRRRPRPPAESATARLARLLTMVPWLLHRQGVDIERAAAELGVSTDQIERDLELLFVCGTPGGLPGDLIEAEWEEGRVYLGNADPIARPLRLGLDEAITLIVGLRTLAAVPGSGDREVIDRALAKLEAAAGAAAGGLGGSDDAADKGGSPAVLQDEQQTASGALPETARRIRVDIADEAETVHLAPLREALAGHRRVHLSYLVARRDELTERDVDPMRVTTIDGHWYLEGWCHRSDDVRLFRLDRITDLRVLDVDGTPPPQAHHRDLSAGIFRPREQDPTVELVLEPAAGWVADYYPTERITELPDGRLGVTLRTADLGWVVRLLLRLGATGRAVAPRELVEAVAQAAEDALAIGGGTHLQPGGRSGTGLD